MISDEMHLIIFSFKIIGYIDGIHFYYGLKLYNYSVLFLKINCIYSTNYIYFVLILKYILVWNSFDHRNNSFLRWISKLYNNIKTSQESIDVIRAFKMLNDTSNS